MGMSVPPVRTPARGYMKGDHVVESAVRRMHLFEFEDLAWFPSALRDMTTDFLQEALVLRHRFYAPATPLIADVLRRTGERRVVDLCSGASGPWVSMKKDLEDLVGPVQLLLTDKFPNRAALTQACKDIDDNRTEMSERSIDATSVPQDVKGLRTIFTAFHHLPPVVAQATLRDAFERRQAICVVEHSERRWPSLLASLMSPPLVAAHALRRRPRSWARIFLTFVVPVLPLIVIWDGTVSALRTYDVRELEEMTAQLTAPDYHWDIGRIERSGADPSLTYLIGRPPPHSRAE